MSTTSGDASNPTQSLFPDWHEMEQIDHLSAEKFDNLPFGAIKLDRDGRIQAYNATEEEISGRRAQDVIGRDFFHEVAPCTNVQEFAGKFREGVEKEELNHVFPYRFDFQMTPVDVWVRLYYSKSLKSTWVFVARRDQDQDAPPPLG